VQHVRALRPRAERFKIGRRWEEGQRCVAGMRFAGERTECPYYLREPGSDDE
jgi:hypothetical protein